MNENRIKVYKLQNMGKSIILKKKKKKSKPKALKKK